MSEIVLSISIIVAVCLGYYLGKGRDIREDIYDGIHHISSSAKDSFKDKPKPGVVNHLTEEEIREKHDPRARGNKEAFDRLMEEYPPERLLEEYK